MTRGLFWVFYHECEKVSLPTRKNVQTWIRNRIPENSGRPRNAAAVSAQRVRPKPDRNFHILKDERWLNKLASNNISPHSSSKKRKVLVQPHFIVKLSISRSDRRVEPEQTYGTKTSYNGSTQPSHRSSIEKWTQRSALSSFSPRPSREGP